MHSGASERTGSGAAAFFFRRGQKTEKNREIHSFDIPATPMKILAKAQNWEIKNKNRQQKWGNGDFYLWGVPEFLSFPR